MRRDAHIIDKASAKAIKDETTRHFCRAASSLFTQSELDKTCNGVNGGIEIQKERTNTKLNLAYAALSSKRRVKVKERY